MKKLLTNPFEKYSENDILLFATAGNFILLIVSFHFNTQFIGNLKINPSNNIEFKDVVTQHALIIFTTTVVLYVTGFYLNAKTRLIDILATCLLSRTVFVFLPLLNIDDKMFKITKQLVANLGAINTENTVTSNLGLLLVFTSITILVLIWFFVLLYSGFKTATNAKDSKSTVVFITAVLIIEIVVQILIKKLT